MSATEERSTDEEPITERDMIAHLMLKLDAMEALIVEGAGAWLATVPDRDARALMDAALQQVELWRSETPEEITHRRRVRMALAILTDRIVGRANQIRDGAYTGEIKG